ncbi:MAG: carboxymuconolactone decarboxylase family protein [Rhodobacteraceae bacterium]|jgi:4-carboxymuconolactone decarboxylase|uniref:4-carboxymuconolactone decarboxylase n=1 Tax=Salipiger profundus TaxID=1229727 RepID=A0A1U7D1M1_9RHOB|nr:MULTISPECIES: carboxymuconolactone decarboxylase family protein [Salipiger]APX22057.1 4-carboxymuconolactone decarboxylase [Salipiger profundus]MAB08227.1 carboxymuconolactone decarboxylase family protein [Paracoccaceae bacterium]GGA07229.1 4-carboxymuconolactone decarboxylase [Salipiger profundus]SFC43074.1 4-carboxymuconolactone decarboxylase [Salipiger profundus]
MKTLFASSALVLASTGAFAQDVARTLPDSVARVAPALESYATNDLFGSVWNGENLSMRDRALVTFAALMTRHETGNLAAITEVALDAGVTPSELSETVTHLAFYTGWGNATAATEAMAPIFEERGIAVEDLPAVDAELLPLDEEAEAARQETVQSNYGDVSQGVVDTTEEILFLDLWLRPALEPRDRSLVTVAGLIAAGQPEQMTFHLNRAMDNGLTQEEAGAMLSHLAFYAGWPRVFSALPVAKQVFEERG